VVSNKQTVTQPNGTQWVYVIDLYEVDIKIPRDTFQVPKSIAASCAKSNMGQQPERTKNLSPV